jgi:hypothetical protein
MSQPTIPQQALYCKPYYVYLRVVQVRQQRQSMAESTIQMITTYR